MTLLSKTTPVSSNHNMAWLHQNLEDHTLSPDSHKSTLPYNNAALGMSLLHEK